MRGWSPSSLLQSYELERRPVALRNTAFARQCADSVGLFQPDPRLEEESAHGAQLRARAGAYLDRHARVEFDIPGISFGARYDGSPVIVADGSDAPQDQPNRYVASACPGGRAPHAWLDDGSSLYDRFGFDYTLLALGGDGALPAAFGQAAARRGLPLQLLSLRSNALRQAYGADYALVRPDQVVAWRGNTLRDGAGAVLDRVAGRPAPGPDPA